MKIPRVLTIVVLAFLCPTLKAAGGSLSAEDVRKIKQVHKNYEEAWLRGNADSVRALFTDDCVLLPPHADRPRVGQKGLNEFWFPPNAPTTTITKLELIPESIGGDGQIAYVWGTHEVAWTSTQDGKTTSVSHKGRFLNVLQKQANGEWKFSHHMWDEPVERQ